LLGVTITEEYIASVVKQARDMPGKSNGILRLHFCVWTDSEVAWIARDVIEPCLADFEISDHYGADLFEGLDLSQNRDITAKASCVRTGSVDVETIGEDGVSRTITKPTFDAWVDAYTPGDTLEAREKRDKLPYSTWVKAGFLNAPQGKSISFMHVAQALADDDSNFTIRMVAYDRFAFRRFEEDCAQLGLDLNFVEHPQGGLKKGKPTEEMKQIAKYEARDAEGLWMPGSVRIVEDALLEGRVRLKRNPVLMSAMMSAVIEEDKWGNHWLAKTRSVNKIDCAIALCMAMGAAMSVESEIDVMSMVA
jgi:phage terminase large subunit-like protein